MTDEPEQEVAGDEESEDEPFARANEHVAPELREAAFHCMHCGVLAQQSWSNLLSDGPTRTGGQEYAGYSRCQCRHCRGTSIWSDAEERCVDPVIGGGSRPHVEMPEDVKGDYEEARRIIGQSPRGACALLRLAVQKLCVDLGEKGDNINADIKSLVEKGLPAEVQVALDSLRVIGNEAVHPGELDLTDDIETATGLFNLLNFVVQDRIAAPKERQAMFAKLPQKAVAAINRRDRS
jgi:hypothetical protein